MTLSSTHALVTIAEWASEARGFSKRSRHAARRVLADQIGVSLAGASRGIDDSLAAIRVSHPKQIASVWARPREQWFAPRAALFNRAMADPLELVAGPEIAAAAVAAAEVADRTFGDVLDAVIAAAEVEDYLRKLLLLAVEAHGLHPPAVLGTAAAATVAGRLLGLNKEQLAGALGAALSLTPASPYSAFSAGASGKYLYGAWSQMLGLSCALWARCGVVGARSVLDGSRGVAQAFLDVSDAVEASHFDPQGDAIERVTFKPYPCSRACHPALSALERMGSLDPNEIEQVTIESYPFSVELEERVASKSSSPIAWQMSVSRTVALALAHGPIDIDSYAEERLLAPTVHRIRERTSVRALAPKQKNDPDRDATLPRRREARVCVVLLDGTVKEQASQAKWGPEAPASDDELRARYDALVGPRTLGECSPWECADETYVRAWIHGGAHG